MLGTMHQHRILQTVNTEQTKAGGNKLDERSGRRKFTHVKDDDAFILQESVSRVVSNNYHIKIPVLICNKTTELEGVVMQLYQISVKPIRIHVTIFCACRLVFTFTREN